MTEYVMIDREMILKVLAPTAWMPIETAPKDGTEILLCSDVIRDIGVCYWRDDEVMRGWTWGCEQRFLGATHWMPLPEPPTGLFVDCETFTVPLIMSGHSPAVAAHTDDIAVDRFAEAMRAKLAKKRDEGRGGWETCPPEILSKMLVDHIAKGDPVDVANFCMMLHQAGQRIQMPSTPLVPTDMHATILDLCDTLENRSDMPLHKWALKSARLVSKIREGITAFPTNGTPNNAGAGV